jgi:hypothetical protein
MITDRAPGRISNGTTACDRALPAGFVVKSSQTSWLSSAFAAVGFRGSGA